MKYFTLEELIERSIERNIDLGKDPELIIRNYVKFGLIPKPKTKKAKTGKNESIEFYPEQTIEKLVQIKALKSEGLSLDEIKDSFALIHVQNALGDILSDSDDDKIKQLAQILSGSKKELESVVEAPLIYLMEGMSEKEAKKFITLFCGVGFNAMLEAQKNLEDLDLGEARKNLFKAVFHNSIATLRLARKTGDSKLEKTALEAYESMVLEPIRRASGIVQKNFIESLKTHGKEKK